MTLTIANVSTQVAQKDLRAAVAAIGKQVTHHFKPEWGIGATLKPIALPLGAKKAPVQKDADAIIYLGDSSSDPSTGVKNAYGYHDANNKGIPYGFVYLDICAQSKEVWTSVLSHEVLELLADPDAVLTVAGPRPKHASGPKPKLVLGTVYYDLEVCDPTQGDQYKIDEVVVSNFVGKRYFGMSGGTGHTNYLGLPLRPFGVRPNGYVQYEQGSRGHQIWGAQVTPAQKQAKKKTQAIRRNARRIARLTGKSA
jgi:hypothetical protein